MEILKTAPGCFDLNNEPMSCFNALQTDHSGAILSKEGKIIFEFVNYVTICGLVVMFGMTANVINIIVFYKQGFDITVNIAFLALAVSDFCCLLSLGWASVSMNPLLPVYDVTWVSGEVMYLSAGWPHICFSRITSYITVYITAERYISIAWPLKVKQIVTAKKTTLIICIIYFVNIVMLIPEYATSYLGWRFVLEKNRTLVGIVFTNNRDAVEGLCHGFHSLLSGTSFFGVIIFTFVLVNKLRQSSQWRKDATLGPNQSLSKSTRERKTVKMVVLISSILIICYIPGAIIAMATFIVGPEFNIRGKFVNICDAVWSIALSTQSVNSSVNIFLYYNMSSKYRHTFVNTFCKRIIRTNEIKNHII